MYSSINSFGLYRLIVRKGSEWWNEEVGGPVAKREELLRNGFREKIGLPMTGTGHGEWL